ncbi:caspase family protein [Microvirga sp. 0TCS3.31]
MRDYYEPQLLPRLLACHEAEAAGEADACKKAFKPVRPLGELNRVQPAVKIVGVRSSSTPDLALVEVEVGAVEDASQKNGKTRTDVYDLRLFRNGQLVGQWPEPQSSAAGPEDLTAWRAQAKVPMPTGKSKTVHTFEVRLAARDKGQPVAFTAYAFNEDRVKSETASSDSYKVPQAIMPAKPRAYVIAVGVNAYENRTWDLNFAAKDAKDISGALRQIRGYEVVPVTLLSDHAQTQTPALRQATKANIQGVLRLLAGEGESDRARLRQELGEQIDKIMKATPDDLVVLAFSGHGYTDKQSRFYLLPSDSGTEKLSEATLAQVAPKLVSSEELSEALRQVDAGELVLIIDACHSAASVETPGFKPGPMGDRGFGQLAYDKGMRILAATQASDVALESEKVGQGLLTYALVQEGLRAKDGQSWKADADRDGSITMAEWLSYGEKRVPGLYEDIRAGKVRSRDPLTADVLEKVTRQAQTPALFDFARQSSNATVLQGQ